MRRNHKITSIIGLIIILLMGSLLTYMTINYDEIRQAQYHSTLQQLNAK